ncbi:MAG: phenylacetate--CoA ligase family protein [Actinomycetota bacterium]
MDSRLDRSGPPMGASLIARVLRLRAELRRHEQWDRARLDEHRTAGLRALRAHAAERSPFYARLHKGLGGRPLEALPILTKGELMEHFDEIVTDPGVRLDDVRGYLDTLRGNERFLGRYSVARTAGSTGHPGIFLWDRREWATVIASYARAQEWAGIRPRLSGRTRMAVVSSLVPSHQSAQVGMSVDSPFLPVRRFDATRPLVETVEGLNAWQPANLVAYASMARLLAEEQLAGRLRIAPRSVICASEVLTPETRRRIEQAWGSAPFNVYASTETAGIASECTHHRLHLYEDLVMTEVVDEDNRPVPWGAAGAKLLVTVLFSRTLPLIRYVLSDSVATTDEPCDCGLPFGVLAGIEGRSEDVLRLPSGEGYVDVHPNLFHRVLEAERVKEWQVIQERDRLRVLLAQPDPSVSPPAVAVAIER